MEPLGHLANAWNVPLLTPWGSAGSIGDKRVFPLVTRLTRFIQDQFVHTLLLLMAGYRWTRLVVLNDRDTAFHQLLGDTVDSILKVGRWVGS